MMLKALALLQLLYFTSAQQCTSEAPLVNYMKCLSVQMNGFPDRPDPEKYREYELEFSGEMKEKAVECESDSGCELGLTRYRPGDFLKKRGVLHKDCKLCWKIVKKVIKFVTKHTDKAMRACLRKSAVVEFAAELAPCIKEKTGNDLPTIDLLDAPDFDRGADNELNEDDVEETLTYAINAFYQASKSECPSKKLFLECFQDLKSYSLPRHCDSTDACVKRISERQNCDMELMEGATCECFEEGREKVKDFVDNVLRTINKALEEDTSTCADMIYNSLESPETGRNLLDVAEKMLSECNADTLVKLAARKNRRGGKRRRGGRKGGRRGKRAAKGGFKKYLRMGCGLGKKLKGGKGKVILTTVIQLVNAAVDALSLRTARFCTATCE